VLSRFLCEAKIVLVNEIVVFDGLNFTLNEVILNMFQLFSHMLNIISHSHNYQYTTIPNPSQKI
jgi:hypothetical protein